MKKDSETLTLEAKAVPSSSWTRRLLWLPVLTVLLFLTLSALSFIEVEHRKPERKISQAPVSKDVLLRYERETKELSTIREKAREKVTAEKILALLEKEKAEELPLGEKLVSDLRTLEKRSQGSTLKAIPGLLSFLKRAPSLKGGEVRVGRAETLLSYAVLSANGPIALGEKERAEALDCLEASVERGSRGAGALLVLLSHAGKRADLERVRGIQGKARGAQLVHEFSKLVEVLEKREVATNG